MKIFLSILVVLINADSLKFIDDRGVEFHYQGEINRVVSLAPNCTDYIVETGAGEKLVGVTYWDIKSHPELKDIPLVSSSWGDINIERIIQLKPDIVLASGINPEESIELLEGLGITVFYIDPQDLSAVIDRFTLIGELLSRRQIAKERARFYRDKLINIENTLEGIEKPTVFYIMDTQGGLWTAGRGTFFDDLVERAGGVNIAKDIRGWQIISNETIIYRDPEVIILGYGIEKDILESAPFNNIRAVRNGRVYKIDVPDIFSRPGPTLFSALEWLTRILHPELQEGKG